MVPDYVPAAAQGGNCPGPSVLFACRFALFMQVNSGANDTKRDVID